MSDDNQEQLCVCMVGLPARGKTYMVERIRRYLTWLSIPTKSFCVQDYRQDPLQDKKTEFSGYFDPKNAPAVYSRLLALQLALIDIREWFNSGGKVATLDATNATRERRKWIKFFLDCLGVKIMFVETICDSEKLIDQKIRDMINSDAKVSENDKSKMYDEMISKIKHYESIYQKIEDEDYTYCQIINVGSSVKIHNISSYLQSRIVFLLTNLHIRPRKIWLSRHGESQYNLLGRIGGDSLLSPRGEQYAKALPQLVKECVGDDDSKLTVWTSTLKRTGQTASFLPYKKLQWKALDELDAGICDGMTYEEIAEKFPEDLEQRDSDKYNYRYRGGESYRDVVNRLEPIILELERQENIVIVCHQAIIRCIYGYYHNLDQEELPYVDIPLHTLIELNPLPLKTEEKRFRANITAVSTHRPKPKKK